MGTILTFYTVQADAWNTPEAVALRARCSTEAEGWAMQGRYWALCGIVARAGGRLNLGEEYLRSYAKKNLDFKTEDAFNAFIETLKGCHLIVLEERVISIPSVDEDKDRLASASQQGRKAAAARWKKGGKGEKPRADPAPTQGRATESQPQPKEPASPAPAPSPEPLPMPEQCPSNAPALQEHCPSNAGAMLRKEGRKKRERPLQGLSLFDFREIQEYARPPVDNSADIEKGDRFRKSSEVEDDSWQELAPLWGPLFEWAARAARGLQENPILYFKTAAKPIENEIAAAGA